MADQEVFSNASNRMVTEHASSALAIPEPADEAMGPPSDPTILQHHRGTVRAGALFALPSEVLQTHIFRYLSDIDIYNLGMMGNKRLREVAEDYVQLGTYLINDIYGYGIVYLYSRIIKQV